MELILTYLELWMFKGKHGFASRIYFNLKLEFVVFYFYK